MRRRRCIPWANRQKGISRFADMAKIAYQLLGDAAALALMPDDSATRLKGKPGRRKRVAWCQPIPLDEVKAVGKALNCSVNDVLLSCVAGAIGEYLRAKGDDLRARRSAPWCRSTCARSTGRLETRQPLRPVARWCCPSASAAD